MTFRTEYEQRRSVLLHEIDKQLNIADQLIRTNEIAAAAATYRRVALELELLGPYPSVRTHNS